MMLFMAHSVSRDHIPRSGPLGLPGTLGTFRLGGCLLARPAWDIYLSVSDCRRHHESTHSSQYVLTQLNKPISMLSFPNHIVKLLC
jgi:hypothetical protein